MRSALVLATVVLAVLGGSSAMMRSEAGVAVLTPDAETVVRSFVISMAAARWDIARRQLAEETGSELTSPMLRQLAAEWRAGAQGFTFEEGSAAGDRFRARLRRWSPRQSFEVTFVLQRHPATRLLKIVAIE